MPLPDPRVPKDVIEAYPADQWEYLVVIPSLLQKYGGWQRVGTWHDSRANEFAVGVRRLPQPTPTPATPTPTRTPPPRRPSPPQPEPTRTRRPSTPDTTTTAEGPSAPAGVPAPSAPAAPPEDEDPTPTTPRRQPAVGRPRSGRRRPPGGSNDG